ncbi:hypothetical protein [Mycobacterium sp. MMS18-G62]
MAKHRLVSARRGRTVAGGIAGAGVLLVAGPAALALADDASPGESTGGRPNFTNPAPVVRMTQSIGDSTFDPNTTDDPITAAIRAQLNASPLGQAYHDAFGYSSVGAGVAGLPAATNGRVTGILNTGVGGGGSGAPSTIPGKVYAQTVNIHECQMQWNTVNGARVATGGWDGVTGAGSAQCTSKSP